MTILKKIKALRTIIPLISLTQAKNLIKKHNDVDTSVKKFHQKNINTIARLAECDDEKKVERYYKIHEYDIEKTVKKIHSELCYLTTDPNINIGLQKIGYILWTKNESLDKYATSRDKSLFITREDFAYVIDAFNAVYPLEDEYNSGTEENIYECGHNHYDNKTCKAIVYGLAEIETEDPNVEKFVRDLIKWFNTRLRYADWIVVYGNL